MEDGTSIASSAGIKQQSQHHQVMNVLEAFKEASQQLQTHPQNSNSNPSVKALLELETESNSLLSSDPFLSSLSTHLSHLKILLQTQEKESRSLGIKSFVIHKIRSHEISRVSSLIESDIQAWIDRESLNHLTYTLVEWSEKKKNSLQDEECLLEKLSQLKNRLAQGFDIELQGLLLKSRIMSKLESLIFSSHNSTRVRETAAYCVKELVLFNKDVFLGQVLVGQTIKALISMGSMCGLEVLKSLIKAIKSPIVDELEAIGGILKVVNTLDSRDLGIKIMVFDCIMEIGYYGRKEAIEALLDAGLIKKLVDLQRSEFDSDLKGFANCVARFAVQLEVGEGLRQREKRAFKQEILNRIREACVSDAEATTIIAEVLWGS